jgi:hypothetical protein
MGEGHADQVALAGLELLAPLDLARQVELAGMVRDLHPQLQLEAFRDLLVQLDPEPFG